MSHGPFIRALREYGVQGTFMKLYKMRTIKFGELKGVDCFGNQYFENRVDYPHGQHRWVEYEGFKNFYQVDASFIAPEWHSWLHHMVDEVPTRTTIGNTHKTPPQANSSGSSAPYARNMGGVVAAPTPNLSQFRPRGYGLSNEVFPESKPNEERFYTQPGWPLDARNAGVAPSGRKARMAFSLRDTPLTIKARAAAKHGMSVAAYERFSDPWSASRVAALVAGPHAHGGAAADGGLDAEQRDALAAALPGAQLPVDAAQARVVAALVAGDGVASDAPGTFAAAVAAVLTADEEALLARGLDASELVAQAAGFQDIIDRYAGGAGGKEGARGVARALEARDGVLATLGALRQVHAKLAALEAAFEANVAATAQQATDAATAAAAARPPQ